MKTEQGTSKLLCESGTCTRRAAHVYGPECEAETGNLMYLCAAHAKVISKWLDEHRGDPVVTPCHGIIGKIPTAVILTKLEQR